MKQAKLLILDSPEDNISCYRYRFDPAEGGLPDLLKTGLFKLTLVVKGTNQARMVLYNGILCGCGLGVEKAGTVELVL